MKIDSQSQVRNDKGRGQVYIPTELHRALRVLCAKLDLTVGQFVDGVLRAHPSVRKELDALRR